jgi:hypothetical protein
MYDNDHVMMVAAMTPVVNDDHLFFGVERL